MVQKQQEFMTTGEVARMFGVSSQHVHRLVRTGRLPTAGRAGKGFLLFNRSDIERIHQERKKNPPQPGRPRTPPGERPLPKKAARRVKKKTK